MLDIYLFGPPRNVRSDARCSKITEPLHPSNLKPLPPSHHPPFPNPLHITTRRPLVHPPRTLKAPHPIIIIPLKISHLTRNTRPVLAHLITIQIRIHTTNRLRSEIADHRLGALVPGRGQVLAGRVGPVSGEREAREGGGGVESRELAGGYVRFG